MNNNESGITSFIADRTAHPHPTPEEFFEKVTMTPNEVAKVISDSLEELSKFMDVEDAEAAQMVFASRFGLILQDKSNTRSVYKRLGFSAFCNKCNLGGCGRMIEKARWLIAKKEESQ